MVTETVVELVVQARARGEAVAAVARAYGLDRKTVRTWAKRGATRCACRFSICKRLGATGGKRCTCSGHQPGMRSHQFPVTQLTLESS